MDQRSLPTQASALLFQSPLQVSTAPQNLSPSTPVEDQSAMGARFSVRPGSGLRILAEAEGQPQSALPGGAHTVLLAADAGSFRKLP